jgi:hypothetical protein
MRLVQDGVNQSFGVGLRYYKAVQVQNDKDMGALEKAEGAYVFYPDYKKFGFSSFPYSKINPDVGFQEGKLLK